MTILKKNCGKTKKKKLNINRTKKTNNFDKIQAKL